MKKTILFAIDPNTQETIVSETEKGSNKVNFLERIPRTQNDLLYDTVVIMTKMTKSPDFDLAIFKAMDNVCQMIYEKNG
jgi:hypothetical protein